MHDSVSPTNYRARWVFPVDGPPLAHGVVSVRNGRIVAIGAKTEAAPVIDLGNVALLPAFVNAHTHLEFSLFDRPLGTPGESFAAWLQQVVAWRREQPAVQGQDELALRHGVQECRAAGVAMLGEISTPLFVDSWSRSDDPLESILFLELLSLNPERVQPLVAIAEQFVQREQPQRRIGLSPHSPYTVHPDLLSHAVRLSAEYKLPIEMHLAESREELELLDSQTGPLVELLKSLTAWYPESLSKGLRPLDYLQNLAKGHRVVIAHGNFLRADEIKFLAQQRESMSVAYCPRTQAYFNHGPYPLDEMLRTGVRVAVGTDSRASNPDLSIWNELQFVRRQYPNIDPAAILNLATLAGAEALGGDCDYGSISPGKLGALVTVDVTDETNSPYDSLFAAVNPPVPLNLPPAAAGAEAQ